jgi:glucuronate isomerase
MSQDTLTQTLFSEICKIPLIDPHTHVNPHQAASKTLDDVLGYHYFTELAHSAGMDKTMLAADVDPRERCRTLFAHLDRFDNTVQYSWFLEIARTFFGYEGTRFTALDFDGLWDAAARVLGQPDWEEQVLKRSNLERVFLTNDFDDPLKGINLQRYVPCLRVDDLVFRLHDRDVRQRLAKATGIDAVDVETTRYALGSVFGNFARAGARACAVSLPPHFEPDAEVFNLANDKDQEIVQAFKHLSSGDDEGGDWEEVRSLKIFWTVVELCREFKLPLALMLGVNRNVYEHGVHQGRDLFDQRTSLVQYANLFNRFPEVTFCVSVLSSAQNQELASYSWIFPNVVTSGHWWYSNVPAYVEQDARARLQAVPKTKQLGFYSDAYKLEFVLPKYNTYRRVLAKVLAEDFVKPKVYTEGQALEMARLLLRDNARWIFSV